MEWFHIRRADRSSAAFRKDLRSAVESARRMAPSGTGRRPRAGQDHSKQLEDILGKLQRVPALPDRAHAIVAAGADLWAGAVGGARRPALERACRRLRSEV